MDGTRAFPESIPGRDGHGIRCLMKLCALVLAHRVGAQHSSGRSMLFYPTLLCSLRAPRACQPLAAGQLRPTLQLACPKCMRPLVWRRSAGL